MKPLIGDYKMTTEEGNKIIAEFMGKRITDSGIEAAFDEGQWHESELQYHTSWDWLMPVLRKIVDSTSQLPTIELRKEARRLYEPIENQLCNFLIQGVHHYVIKFIQWYNTQTQNK